MTTPTQMFVLLRLDLGTQQQEAVLALEKCLIDTPFEIQEVLVSVSPKQRKNSVLPVKLKDADIALLQLLADGKSNKEIAVLLIRQYDSVNSHLKRLYKKLGVKSRSEAVAWMLRAKLIE